MPGGDVVLPAVFRVWTACWAMAGVGAVARPAFIVVHDRLWIAARPTAAVGGAVGHLLGRRTTRRRGLTWVWLPAVLAVAAIVGGDAATGWMYPPTAELVCDHEDGCLRGTDVDQHAGPTFEPDGAVTVLPRPTSNRHLCRNGLGVVLTRSGWP